MKNSSLKQIKGCYLKKETQNDEKISGKIYNRLIIKLNVPTEKKRIGKTFQSVRCRKVNCKVVFSVCIVALLLLSIFATHGPIGNSNLVRSATVYPSKILVPDDYPTLSDAIGNASQGDTIYVKDGIYCENPVIDKSISIIGEDSKNTIVVGNGGAPGDNVFTIMANDVKISGFTIESKSYSNSSYYASGISIGAGTFNSITIGEETVPSNSVGGDNCTIIGNNIVNAAWGIVCCGGGKSDLTISQNNITANTQGGISLYGGSSKIIYKNTICNNTNGAGVVLTGYLDQISDNIISGNMRGIELGSSNTIICRNNITENRVNGIYVQASSNSIVANSIADNLVGIYMAPNFITSSNKIYSNNFINNSQNVFTGSGYNIQSWDNGYPVGGNYWSNYTGSDVKIGTNQNQPESDGIGDTPFIVGINNTDSYPLMSPFAISTLEAVPTPILPAYVSLNHLIAQWNFGEIQPNLVILDSTGKNAAIVGCETDLSYTPVIVKGKFGSALNFTDNQYLFVNVSPSLDTNGEITIDAWIKVNAIENYSYNNIIVKCTLSDTSELPPRILGLSINGLMLGNGSAVPVGAIRGYITTETGGFNEIATTSVIPLDEWIHITFTRNFNTGMHIYVNGMEQNIVVTSGVQNPTGPIIRGSELYIGHGFSGAMAEVTMSNIARSFSTTHLWAQLWFFGDNCVNNYYSINTIGLHCPKETIADHNSPEENRRKARVDYY